MGASKRHWTEQQRKEIRTHSASASSDLTVSSGRGQLCGRGGWWVLRWLAESRVAVKKQARRNERGW